MPQKPPLLPHGQSKSTPNLPTLRTFDSSGSNTSSATASIRDVTPQRETISPDLAGAPSEPASTDDYSLDSNDRPSISDSDSDSGDDAVQAVHLPPRPLHSLQSKSHTYLGPWTFAPPFYGRPPTPLPPSPSLTSLLRPTFSSQNSRPTTPDPSSDEGTSNTRGDATGTQTPNSAAASTLTSSFRTAKPIPRASPKVPTYEYYGFTLYLTSSLGFVMYLLWSFLPAPFLEQLGIYYYPDRWWALAIPAWTVMFILYIYVALASFNTGYLTLPMNSVECLVDEASNVAVVNAEGNLVRGDQEPSWASHSPDKKRGKKGGKSKGGRRSRRNSLNKAQQPRPGTEIDWRSLWNEGTDAVMDIPLGGVCEILYGEGNKVKIDDNVNQYAHEDDT